MDRDMAPADMISTGWLFIDHVSLSCTHVCVFVFIFYKKTSVYLSSVFSRALSSRGTWVCSGPFFRLGLGHSIGLGLMSVRTLHLAEQSMLQKKNSIEQRCEPRR